MFEGVKITRVPTRPTTKVKTNTTTPNLLSMTQFNEEIKETGVVYVLYGKEVNQPCLTSDFVRSLLCEFQDVFPEELPDELPPLHDIQHLSLIHI